MSGDIEEWVGLRILLGLAIRSLPPEAEGADPWDRERLPLAVKKSAMLRADLDRMLNAYDTRCEPMHPWRANEPA